jgi:hypothetical protein
MARRRRHDSNVIGATRTLDPAPKVDPVAGAPEVAPGMESEKEREEKLLERWTHWQDQIRKFELRKKRAAGDSAAEPKLSR